MNPLARCECYDDNGTSWQPWPRFIVVLWMCVAAAFATLWLLLVFFRVRRFFQPYLNRVWHKPTSCREAIADSRGGAKTKDEEEQKYIWRAMQEMRACRLHAYANGWALVLPPMVVGSVSTAWQGWPSYNTFFEEHLWFEGLFAALYGFYAVYCQKSTAIQVMLVHSVIVVSFCGRLFTYSQEHTFHHNLYVMALARLLFAFMGNPALTAALNTLFVACEVVIVFYNDIWGINKALVVYFVVCIFSWMSEKSFESEAESKLAAEVAREGKARVQDILSHVCDAVLELNEALTISTESPNFGAIALHGASCHGRCFTDFIVCEDRERLLQFLQSNSEGNVSSCSAQLVIPPSNTVRVTVWHSFSTGLNGQKRHLIGVQEDQQDVSRAPLPPLRDEPWQRRQRKKTESQRRRRQCSSTQKDIMQIMTHGPVNCKPDTIAVKVSTADDLELPIIELTLGAQLLLGPSVGIGSLFGRFVPQLDPFLLWIQQVMNHYLSGHLNKATEINHFDMTLLTHTSPSPVLFTCHIMLSDCDFDDETMPVHFVFRPSADSNISSSNSSSNSSSSGNAELTDRRGNRRGHGGSRRSHSSDSEQPCSGVLAPRSSARCQQLNCL